MQDSEAADSLRDILAKSPQRTPTHRPSQPSGGITTSDQGALTPSPSKPLPIRAMPALEYPAVNVPGSSPKSASVVTPSSSPKSIFGRNVFGSPKSSSGLIPRSRQQRIMVEASSSPSVVEAHGMRTRMSLGTGSTRLRH
jgi:hypothetical protein